MSRTGFVFTVMMSANGMMPVRAGFMQEKSREE